MLLLNCIRASMGEMVQQHQTLKWKSLSVLPLGYLVENCLKNRARGTNWLHSSFDKSPKISGCKLVFLSWKHRVQWIVHLAQLQCCHTRLWNAAINIKMYTVANERQRKRHNHPQQRMVIKTLVHQRSSSRRLYITPPLVSLCASFFSMVVWFTCSIFTGQCCCCFSLFFSPVFCLNSSSFYSNAVCISCADDVICSEIDFLFFSHTLFRQNKWVFVCYQW